MTELERQLTEQVVQLTSTVNELKQIIVKQNQLIAELREQLNKNSRNSSKPPSSDGYKKPAPKSLREKSGKKPGGQAGHKGEHLKIAIEPSKIITYMPDECRCCSRYEVCQGHACISETRRVVDACVDVKVTAHEAMEVVCPLSGKRVRGSFPEAVKGPIQYGETLQALIVAFSTVGAVSTNRIHELFGNVFGIPLSTSTIVKMVHQCSDKLVGTEEQLKQRMANAGIAHFDETGIRVDKHLRWVHVASDRNSTYLYMSNKRGKEGMDEGNVLPLFHGIAIHDCWASYWKYGIEHGVCCAHLLRELIGIQENHPEQKWAKRFQKLLLKMKAAKDTAISSGNEILPDEIIREFEQEYDRILKSAYKRNPEPGKTPGKKGKPKRGKILALIDRLHKYKASVCLFIKNFAVPFDNNQAERDLRMVKVKTKVSGCFRTEDGAKDFLRIMSYTGTAKKRGKNPYEAIRLALLGQPIACD